MPYLFFCDMLEKREGKAVAAKRQCNDLSCAINPERMPVVIKKGETNLTVSQEDMKRRAGVHSRRGLIHSELDPLQRMYWLSTVMTKRVMFPHSILHEA